MARYHEDTCPARNEIREIKSDVANMKVELREVRTTLQVMENIMASQLQRSEAEIVVAGGQGSNSVEIFNMTMRDIWRPLPEMNKPRNAPSSVLHQGRMFVTGGETPPLQNLSSVEELNLAQQDGHWVESQFQLPKPSRGHACVVYQDHFFVIGGQDRPPAYDTIHEIQMTSPHTSRMLARTPQPRCYHGAEIVNDKVYIAGGCTTVHYRDSVDSVVMFDPQTNTCTEQRKTLPYPVTSMATATWKDNVVLLGGLDREHNALNSVVMYNVTTGSHRMLPEMGKKRFGCTAVTIGDSIVVIGGRDENEADLNSVECFNFDTNTWTDFPVMAEARLYPTAVVKYS